jgi:hypothetical protein
MRNRFGGPISGYRSVTAMDKPERLFRKWQGWIKPTLLADFQRLLHDQRIFNAYLESLNPYVGRKEGAEIAEWIGLNYFGATCIALRRLDDADNRTISLRRLLADLRANARLLTSENLAKYNPRFRSIPDEKRSPEIEMEKVLAKEIGLLDQFGGQIRVFVNKMVAHRDSDASEIAIPNIGGIEKAIFCYHALFRKYAFIIAGIPCDFNNPNPLDLLPPTDQEYTKQFTRLWLADPETAAPRPAGSGPTGSSETP